MLSYVLFCSVLLCYVGMATTSMIVKIICLELHYHKRKKEIAKIWLMCSLKRSCTIYLVKNKTKKTMILPEIIERETKEQYNAHVLTVLHRP